MPDGYRLWRTADGDLVPDEHPDAVVLAYGTGDPLKVDDADNVRDLGAEPSEEPTPIQGNDRSGEPLDGDGNGVLDALEGADSAAETDSSEGDQDEPDVDEAADDETEVEPEPEKVVDQTTPKRPARTRKA